MAPFDSRSVDTTLHLRRRERLLATLGQGVLVLPAPPVYIRNNDVEHEHRQDSDLYYLTGFDEPESVLVLTGAHKTQRAVLFVRPRNPERETWDGPREGLEGVKKRPGIDEAYEISELGKRLPEYLAGAEAIHYRLGIDAAFDRMLVESIGKVRRLARTGVRAPASIVDVSETIHEMRMRKEPAELDLMREAARITEIGHRRAMEVARPGRFEYEVEAELVRAFRENGSTRAAYGSIVGSGVNATILHYRKNDRRMEEGELLLIDAGCELGYYACDVTRTFPISGRFSRAQRAVYDVVLAAQAASIAAVKPGATLEQAHEVAVRELTRGMIDLGLVEGPLDDAIAKGRYKPFYMHRTSHWLGMDVHDVGAYFAAGRPRPLEPGFVLTVEPGLYVAKDAEAPPELRGIGIRIEDDILVTDAGHENLTGTIPKDPAEIERILAARA